MKWSRTHAAQHVQRTPSLLFPPSPADAWECLPLPPRRRVFEEILRTSAASPKAQDTALHLRRFAEEGVRQQYAAAMAAAEDAAAQGAAHAAFRSGLQGQMESSKAVKGTQMAQDLAVHAAIRKHQVRHAHDAACRPSTAGQAAL